MTVKATIDSTLNGQSADLILIEDGDTRSYEEKALAGGTETFIFTGLDGGSDKEYTAKIVPSTSDVTQTSEVNYGATVDIDPIPHRDVDADSTIREEAEFNNGVATKELGLGDNPLIQGLLTSALNDGEVLADDGFVYSTVQAAQDAASSWIFIGPGTFNEAVTIDTAGLTVQGSGYDTLIDGGTIGTAVTVSENDVTIKNLSVRTTGGSGNGFDGFEQTDQVGNSYINCRVVDSDLFGIFITGSGSGSDNKVISCTVESSDASGVRAESVRTTVYNCTFEGGIGADGCIFDGNADDSILSNCVMNSVGSDGHRVKTGDCIAISNRIISSLDAGIAIQGSDDIIANNRVSDSGGSDISNTSGGGLLDGNNTGASN